MNKPWDGIVSQKDQEAYRAAGFGGRSGLGARSGLLIINSPACACEICFDDKGRQQCRYPACISEVLI